MDGGWPAGLDDEIAEHRARSRRRMGKRIGDPADPLLVCVRSGAKFSMPGMMDTVLNLGLNDRSVEGLAAQTGDRRSPMTVPPLHPDVRQDRPRHRRRGLSTRCSTRTAKSDAGAATDAEHPGRGAAGGHRASTRRSSQNADRRAVPPGPDEQLRGAIEAVFKSWDSPRARAYRRRERIADDLGTAVNVQAMVFGNRDEQSCTGVGFTRNPATGEAGCYGDFLVNAQGEDVVAGIRTTRPSPRWSVSFPVPSPSCSTSSNDSSATIATCSTPSSRSSTASCGCSR